MRYLLLSNGEKSGEFSDPTTALAIRDSRRTYDRRHHGPTHDVEWSVVDEKGQTLEACDEESCAKPAYLDCWANEYRCPRHRQRGCA